MCLRVPRVSLQRRPVRVDRGISFLHIDECVAHVVVQFGAIQAELSRRLIVLERVPWSMLQSQTNSEVMLRVGEIRLQLERFFVISNRTIEIALLASNIPHSKPGGRIGRADINTALQTLQRLIEAA